ncbi:M64 family metallopeptidase [Verrucomicrobium sp. BvORR034]|uniref:M64 family metallopeptidase n=1 Tax=Verrucomicrobium sp. BvORR034 TaxID=1396418 RepID=UPI000678CDFC|nr:M64 family metallopeptidase [Verrucomicrobium sp. BvORR034]
MADPLPWKEGGGYDVHVLRGGPASEPLDVQLELSQDPNALAPVFLPHFQQSAVNHGVTVDPGNGQVTAATGAAAPFQNFNFLMTARQVIGGVGTLETQIRVHVHGSVKKLWLTPETLNPRVGSDEMRFTVLAQFDDDTVGDITDWPQLSYTSSAPAKVKILPASATVRKGTLSAVAANTDADITVSLVLSALSINLQVTGKAFALPSWADAGQAAKVAFVDGGSGTRPDETDPDGSNPTSVRIVVEKRTNVLFISDGFTDAQENEFRQMVVDVIVNKELRSSEILQPFKLLEGVINYWSVFVPSREEGIGVLGDQVVQGAAPALVALDVPLPRTPPTSLSRPLTLEEMIHAGGLPVPAQPALTTPAAWFADRNVIYDLQFSPSDVDQGVLDEWNLLQPRTLLNERNTAFGLAHQERTRISAAREPSGRLVMDARRTTDASLETFLKNLKFGLNATTNVRASIGETWADFNTSITPAEGRDFGLVCFICRSSRRGGSWKSLFQMQGTTRMAYFSASTGGAEKSEVSIATNGHAITPPTVPLFSSPMVASVVAYGCARALGLNDEAGDGQGAAPAPSSLSPFGENLQPEVVISSVMGGVRTINAPRIAWVWPRVTKGVRVKVDVNFAGVVVSPQLCDTNGIPNPSGTFLLFEYLDSAPDPFPLGVEVRFRAHVEKLGSSFHWTSPRNDLPLLIPLRVHKLLQDKVVISDPSPAGLQITPTTLVNVGVGSLLTVSATAGVTNSLIAPSILNHIDTSDGPLNAARGPVPPPSAHVCTPSNDPQKVMSPTNLPTGFKKPRKLPSRADIIGIYDGGGHLDCGVYRPAGRCRMRHRINASLPFCQVCRYVIVDKVDPALQGALDVLYAVQYP